MTRMLDRAKETLIQLTQQQSKMQQSNNQRNKQQDMYRAQQILKKSCAINENCEESDEN